MDIEIIEELKKEFENHLDDVELLITYMNKIPDAATSERAYILENAQEVLNKLYEYHSCDVLIDVQVVINQYRHEYDITDPREVLHVENGKGFVQ